MASQKTCAGCQNTLPKREYIICVTCKLGYDLLCANLTSKHFHQMDAESRTKWICQQCRSKLPKTGNLNTPVRTSNHPIASKKDYIPNPGEESNVTMRIKNKNTKPDNSDSCVTEEMLRIIIKQEITDSIKSLQNGFRPQLNQFGYRPPVQFGYRHPQQPQQFGFTPQVGQFGYRHPQPSGYQPQKANLNDRDVTMRTAPAPAKPQQGFPVNELYLDQCPDAEYSKKIDVPQSTENKEDSNDVQNFQINSIQIPEMIELNYDANLRHPYIYVPDINGKFMLDIGSTRSFISPEKVEAYFADAKQYEPFTVTSTHASSVHHEVANILLFSIFNDSGYHIFYIYIVDHRYDGLIGMELMSRLSSDICLKDKILKTNSANIPIVYNTNHELLLDPRTEHRVRLPVNQKDGLAILDYKQFRDGVRMPTAIVRMRKLFCTFK
ncbi:unnamed protein product [Leptidea sinapis]|uniref:PHD-type domain-containing protein n=1 Tax=Leptidea sinapis TaxID=189913 RepID=A0A5E4PLG4_9NEOP|nr:unnamed protein product [Leptidea sinapis]